jgi:eukaryotic-like serine/threonine-protein kinase
MDLHCPHCHSPIDLADADTRGDILCPACGSTFRLHELGTTTFAPMQRLGRFEVIEVVGQGAFGTVYKGRDPDLDRAVALKVPRAGQLAGPADVARLTREARSVAQLRHPSIVSIHEVGSSAGVPFLVSEFVEGVTLADWLSARRATFAEAARWAADLADALHFAHGRGVVHRDVKPSNVMMELVGENAYRPRLTDFGLARRDAGDVTVTTEGQVLGTPAYMSPEQAAGEGHSVDGRADVYSLGVLLYQLLTGELPFRGTPRMLIHQILHDEPRPPRGVNGKVPRDLETITLKAMAREPCGRYATAAELGDDLRRYLAGEPIRARPAGRVERAWRWARRRPAVAALLAVFAIVLAAGGTTLAVLWRRADDADSQRATAKGETVKSRASARQHEYSARASQMMIAWRDRALGRVGELLDEQKSKAEDLRGFEWHYYRRLLDGTQLTLAGHTDAITAVVFSGDRRHLATGSRDGTAKVWELATGRQVRGFAGHSGGVAGLALAPDGRRLATVARDGTVRVLETATGKELFSLAKRTAGRGSVAFSPDGRRLVVAGDPKATIYDETGKEIRSFEGHSKRVTAVAFSPDGQRVASAGDDGPLWIWEAASGKRLESYPHTSGSIASIVFKESGQELILTTGDGGLLKTTAQGRRVEPLKPYDTGGEIRALSRDGKLLAQANPADMVRVVEPGSSRELFSLRGHTGPVTCLAFSRDGERIATGSEDRTAKVWSAALHLGTEEYKGHAGEVFAVAYSPDGKHLASAGADGSLRVREASSGQEVLVVRAHQPIFRGAVSPDKAGHTLQGATTLAYSRDGARLASGGSDGAIRVWDAGTGKLLRQVRAHAKAVTGVAFSPDGLLLASSSWDKTVKLWDAATVTPRHTLTGHTREATRVAFRPDGQFLASCGWDQTIRLWDPATGKEVKELKWVSRPGRIDPIDSLAFHPDGRHLAAAPDQFAGGGEVRVFDLETGETVHSLAGHVYGIFQVVYSADGRRLASCSCDGGLKVWDAATGQELFGFNNRTGLPPGADGPINTRRDAIHSVAFSPDGLRLALGCRNSLTVVLDATPTTPELLVQREANRLVHATFDELVTPAAVAERLAGRQDLSEELRSEAIARAKRFRQDPNRLNDQSWSVVSKPGRAKPDYDRALLQAREACRLVPGRGELLNTLGAAQYRAGQWQAAVETLTESDKLQTATPNGSHPIDLALLAMAHHRLGQPEKAGAALGRLREAMKSPLYAKNLECHAFLKEAEALVKTVNGPGAK